MFQMCDRCIIKILDMTNKDTVTWSVGVDIRHGCKQVAQEGKYHIFDK